MSLDAWEEQILGSIADGLTASAPELASRLSVFNRLACGEQMPEDLRARGGERRGRHDVRPDRRAQRGRASRHGPKRGLLARAAERKIWLAIPVLAVMAVTTAILIAVALVQGPAGHKPGGTRPVRQCPTTWALVCPRR